METARRATAADIERVATLAEVARAELGPSRGGEIFLVREARGEPLVPGLAALVDAAGQELVVGTFDEVVVGYGTGRVEALRDGRMLGVIDDLFVEEEARGVGVGEAMMNLLLEWFGSQGCVGVDALALPGARATKNFFEESGFTARLLVMHHRL